MIKMTPPFLKIPCKCGDSRLPPCAQQAAHSSFSLARAAVESNRPLSATITLHNPSTRPVVFTVSCGCGRPKARAALQAHHAPVCTAGQRHPRDVPAKPVCGGTQPGERWACGAWAQGETAQLTIELQPQGTIQAGRTVVLSVTMQVRAGPVGQAALAAASCLRTPPHLARAADEGCAAALLEVAWHEM
jgi:hypothetical protein